MRLEVRVTLWVLVLLGLASAATLGAMSWFQARTIDRQAVESGRLVALSVRDSLKVGMLNNAPDEIRKVVTGIKAGTYVQSVAVHRRDGSTWVSSNHVPPGTAPTGIPQRTVLEGEVVTVSRGDRLSVYVPVLNEPSCIGCHADDPDVLGAVAVTLDERPLRGDVSSSARKSLFIAAAPLLLGVVLTIWALRRAVLRPLSQVETAAGGLASGDLTTRLPPMRGAEFSTVADALNDMASRLQRQSTDLTGMVERLRADVEGMEEIQSLIGSDAGLPAILTGTAAYLGPALGATGVAIWRSGRRPVEASWGDHLPPADVARSVTDGITVSSAGPLGSVPEAREVAWVAAPAVRGQRTLAVVGVAWDPGRPLPAPERDLIGSMAGLVAVAIENAELLERFREEEESLQTVLADTLATQEEERRRIARELHDDTSQILHALMMNIDLLASHQAAGEFKDRLEAVKALAEMAGANLDKVLNDLRPALLDELGLVAAFRWYVSQVREAWGLSIDFETEHVGRLGPNVEVAAFRIAQEAVANAVRHGQPERIAVRLAVEADVLTIEVRDDGKGFDVSDALERARRGDAVGLLGMRERTELLGGRLHIESSPGTGTTLVATIPLQGSGNHEGKVRHDRQDRRAGR